LRKVRGARRRVLGRQKGEKRKKKGRKGKRNEKREGKWH